MTRLTIKYREETGSPCRISIDKAIFTVGRHSENDLSIANSKLSREHIKIEKFGGVFVVTDCGSSNGTTVNGEKLEKPVKLQKGDRLNLGGGIEIEIEITEQFHADVFVGKDEETGQEETAGAPANDAPLSAASETPEGSHSSLWFLAGPIAAVLILVLVAAGIFLFRDKNESANKQHSQNEFIYSDDDDYSGENRKSRNETANNSNTPSQQITPVEDSTSGEANLPSNEPGGSARIEQHASAFLRQIAQNDPRAFLTTDKAERVAAKAKQFNGSAALAENIRFVGRNAAQIRALAASKNLKPQFVATAALARLGNSRGDVLQTAQGMSDVLDKLGTHIGNESADDCLLMIAAFNQGAAGETLKMRNMLQDLATKFPASTREIRTIWFLHKNGKITDAEFEFALRFLAIGVITQNPREFGVNAEALKF